jgi:hypothetical protein
MNVHAPLEHTWSAPHAVPQAPQLARSVWSETQRAAPPSPPRQRLSARAQLATQAPVWQICPAAQVVPQAPQLAGSPAGSTQRPPRARPGVDAEVGDARVGAAPDDAVAGTARDREHEEDGHQASDGETHWSARIGPTAAPVGSAKAVESTAGARDPDGRRSIRGRGCEPSGPPPPSKSHP